MLNYLKETLRFLEAVKAAPVSPRAQVLWHYLLYFNNQAAIALDNGDYYWPVWFTVDNAVLTRVIGIQSSSRLYNFRRSLIDRGWVRYRLRSARGGPAGNPLGDPAAGGEYALTPFTPGYTEGSLKLSGYHTAIPVWVSSVSGDGIAGEGPSNYTVNDYKSINPLFSITPPSPACPSPRSNAFDEVAERGRAAALGWPTDRD